MSQPLNMDVHAPRNPAGYWPPGFREKVEAQAAAIVERDNAPEVNDVIAKLRAQLPSMLQHELFTGPMGLSYNTALAIGTTLRDIVLERFIRSVTVTTEGTVTVVDHRTKEPTT